MRLRTLDCTGAHRGRHLPPTPEELRAEVARITGRDVPMGQARWLSRFSDFSRITLSYRAGRILLAGDAAHVHFPVGGQGLSAGVLDALNLGWKLALAVRGAAAPPACWTPTTSSAARPRSASSTTPAPSSPSCAPTPAWTRCAPSSANCSPAAGAAGRTVCWPPWSAPRTRCCPRARPIPPPWEGRFLANTELTTAQGRTDVIRLLAAGRPLLLLCDGADSARWQAQARPWSGLLRVVRTGAQPALPGGAVLLRPDGYVGWAAGAGSLTAALGAYAYREGAGWEHGPREPDTTASTGTGTGTGAQADTGSADTGTGAGAGVGVMAGAGVGDAVPGGVR